MKNLLLIIVLFLGFNTIAQDRNEKFAGYLITEPGAYSDGFNIGAGIEYQMNYAYFGAQYFTFPDLNGKTYNHLIGTIGFNFFNRWNEYRIFLGLRAGPIINRSSALIGIGTGIDFNIPKTSLYVGADISADYRTDAAYNNDYIGGQDKEHWVNNVGVKIGYKW